MNAQRRRGQRGQETLQAVLAVSFMVLPVLLGVVELGQLIHVWIGQESAATAGARAAGERGEDDAFVRARISLSLQTSGIDPGRVAVQVTPRSVGWGQPITVRLVSRRRIAIPFLFSRDVTLTTAAVARGEVDH
jgi:Flp pilus assembly protein TadG